MSEKVCECGHVESKHVIGRRTKLVFCLDYGPDNRACKCKEFKEQKNEAMQR